MMPTDTIRPARALREKAVPAPPADPPSVSQVDDPPPVSEAAKTSRPPCLTGRRRLVDPSVDEAELSAAEVEFMDAMQEYKRKSGRMFPTWSEVLEVLQGLGYEKVAGPGAGPYSQAAIVGGPS
jgi:hypothetical protein